MKQSKVIGIILVVLNIALAVVCIILSAGQDKTKPVFDFQAAEVVYRTGMDEEKLKEGITARDNVDGDITDRIVVEKIVTDPAENTSVVFFAVSTEPAMSPSAPRYSLLHWREKTKSWQTS